MACDERGDGGGGGKMNGWKKDVVGMKTKEHLFHNLMLYPLTKFFFFLRTFDFNITTMPCLEGWKKNQIFFI